MTCNRAAPGEAVGRKGTGAAAGSRCPRGEEAEAVCRYPAGRKSLVGWANRVAAFAAAAAGVVGVADVVAAAAGLDPLISGAAAAAGCSAAVEAAGGGVWGFAAAEEDMSETPVIE